MNAKAKVTSSDASSSFPWASSFILQYINIKLIKNFTFLPIFPTGKKKKKRWLMNLSGSQSFELSNLLFRLGYFVI